MAELGKLRTGKERGVTYQLVDDVGLWGVEGLGVMPDVLCRIKNTEGKGVQEIARGKKPSCWLYLESSCFH